MFDEKIYRSSDIYFSAYLKVAGVRFVGTDKEDRRVFFKFENSESIRDLKNEFYARKAKVSAMDFADEIKAMKSLIFDYHE